MKKILVLMAVVSAVSLCGCGKTKTNDVADNSVQSQITEEPQNGQNQEKDNANDVELTPSQKSLSDIQKKIAEKDALCGIAFLGAVSGDFDEIKAQLKEQNFYDYLYVDDITVDRFAENSGSELYVVIPVSEDVTITVSEYFVDLSEDYSEGVGRELLKVKDGLPVMVRGNVSDIMANIHVKIEDIQATSAEYRPSISLRDGMISRTPFGVCDMTPYEKMGLPSIADSDACGKWKVATEDGDGNERILLLWLKEDGKAVYSYGASDSDIMEQFEGEWYDGGESLSIEMKGGLAQTGVGTPYDLNSSFEYELSEGNLVLYHIDGSALLNGAYGQTFEFEAVND